MKSPIWMEKRGKMKIMLFIISAITLTLSFVVYQESGDKLRMHSDPKDMKKEILKKVPIGSRIEDAKRIMEENGFGCRLVQNDVFSEDKDGDPNNQVLHEGADFLSCDKSKTTFPPVMREWFVAIVHKDGIVSEVFVNSGLTGP